MLRDGGLVGVLRREDLVKALADGRRESMVADVMCRACDPVNELDVLIPALEKISRNQCATAPVLGGNGRIVGLLTVENVGELVMVNASLDRPLPGTV